MVIIAITTDTTIAKNYPTIGELTGIQPTTGNHIAGPYTGLAMNMMSFIQLHFQNCH
jgi:hypothetical protein